MGNNIYKVFIAEDDDGIANAVAKRLSQWDFDVRRAENYRDVYSEFADYEPHIVLLDISLPFYNGFHWCEEIRQKSTCPIMFISGASDNMNIVTAMTLGADDFIAKPFDLDVLTAKIRALLRRSYDFASEIGMIEVRGAVLNTGDATLTFGGEKIELTKNEYRILETLFENRGRIVSRETLMNKLWQTDSFIDENTLSVNIMRLRKKLESAGLADLITTKVGRGYSVSD